ncbi:MAG: hypothetical protein KKH52_04910 [Nanoarchaeota archaeon]|nr:hypothetical protein [Nanoarchaeota archaeon]MBU1622805.1 hypothetical protein [Nanoarchaeota archaeon]MBU1974706.1 hypothetical protein [Nanoarchaeota archaeon]
MKKIIILGLLLVFLLPLVLAAGEVLPPGGDKGGSSFGSDSLSGENGGETLPKELQSLIDTIQPFMRQASLLVGGLFGLYLILILARVHYERKKVHILKDIRYDLDRLNMHYGLSYSRQKKGFFKRMIGFFKGRSYEKKVNKENRQLEKKK